MVKYIKYVIVILIIGVIGAGIFYGLYFVTQFSAVFPPIKTYEFTTDVNGFESTITNYIENSPRVTYQKTDTVGNVKNGFAYYMKINLIEQNIEYLIKYENSNSLNGNIQHSEIKLIHIFDKNRNEVGYKIKDEGVLELLELFESEIVVNIELKTSP